MTYLNSTNMTRNSMHRFVISALLLAVTAAVGFAEPWSQFRGANGSGVSQDKQPLPAALGQGQNALWKVDVVPGVPAPVVLDGRI